MKGIGTFVFISIIGLFLCVSCKTTKAPIALPNGDHISFGYGGGVAGTEITHSLFPNGKLYLHHANSQVVSITPNSIKNLRPTDLYNSIGSMPWTKLQVSDPGNRYSFMDIQMNGIQKRLIWGGGQQIPDPKILRTFNLLQSLVSK
jgi:hypothetical protein